MINKQKAMAAEHSMSVPTNLIGMVLTGVSLIYAKITASDLASILTGVLAITNLIIAWPKLKLRLKEIFNKNKNSNNAEHNN